MNETNKHILTFNDRLGTLYLDADAIQYVRAGIMTREGEWTYIALKGEAYIEVQHPVQWVLDKWTKRQ